MSAYLGAAWGTFFVVALGVIPSLFLLMSPAVRRDWPVAHILIPLIFLPLSVVLIVSFWIHAVERAA